MSDIVYSSDLDKKYLVEVVRGDDSHSGVLTIKDLKTKEELHRKSVTLSYGAVFGPDMLDVSNWEEFSCKWADEQAKKST